MSAEEVDQEVMEEEVGGDEAVAGEDAIVAVSALLFQKIQEDEAAQKYMEDLDMAALAPKLHELLTKVFDGEEWPEIVVSQSAMDECYADFSVALAEVLEKTEEGGLQAALETMTNEMVDDERVQGLFACIQNMVVGGEAEEEEAAEEGDHTGDEQRELDAAAKRAAKDAAGTDVNVNSFDELHLDDNVVQASNDIWRLFINTADSREAAGEAIYAALFDAAPSLQSLFVTPRAVQAMRFMNGLASFVQALNEPDKLKILVETLGFGHLHLDVTVPRVVIFRDAIMDLFNVELAERFTSDAQKGWRALLNYVGGAIIYIKANYAVRINTLLTSWKKANHGNEEDVKADMASSDMEALAKQNREAAEEASGQKKGLFGNMLNSSKTGGGGEGVEGKGGAAAGGGGGKNDGSLNAQSVPTTYPEMFKFNAAVMGFGESAWMTEVLACFHNIVTNVANSGRLQEECDVLALRIAKVLGKKNVNLGEYKSCMMASLRSLLPKDWDSAHEVAWTWLWENVERLILKIHGQPPGWTDALNKFLSALDEEMKFEIRRDIYNKFFTLAPAGQDYFKQSNTYLHIIADKVLAMTLELYINPVKMVDDVSALGLRHVGYAIPTELFGPFVSASVEVMMTRTSDEKTIESFRWSLGLIGKMLVRTITEGSTIVMKAINSNSSKMLKKAIGCAPRGERSNWMLLVQVGTQSISPLLWSVESGNFESGTAIMRDLLSFRADRDRYYYGVDDLFGRHPDIIKVLCDAAPDLVPKLLDGLIWRSRLTENGMRRVNYYVKHLLVDTDGSLNKCLAWIAATKDPKLVCHPVVVLVSDIIWVKVALRTFLWGKSSFLFTVAVFVTSQSILQHVEAGKDSEAKRIVIFVCRAFIYLMSMCVLLYSHVTDTVKAYRSKNTIKLGCIRVPRYLKQWQDAASFCLAICLVGMIWLEPIIRCWEYADGKLFFADCKENEGALMPYTIFAMAAMMFYYILLIDLTVVSTRISAFSLVCVRMISEVALFLGALLGSILTFASATSALDQVDPDFAGIPKAAYALLRMVLGAFDSTRYTKLHDEPALEIMVFLFLIITAIFFLSMLVAQLSCAYSAVYEDMVGYARLERTETIVEIVTQVSKARWSGFVEGLRLGKRLEFNAGDIGVAGGIQMREAANIHPTTVDMIKRFGGSTSPEAQWPEDEAEGDGEDKFEKMEKLLQRTLQRITKTAGIGGKRGKAGTGTGTGTGSGTGSGQDTGDSEGSVQDEEEE